MSSDRNPPLPDKPPSQHVFASLSPSNIDVRQFLDTAAGKPPTGYYVIIGRGTAAMVNHTTLRQGGATGKARLKHPARDEELPVLHIGLEDPWLHYHRHGMGQPPYLLRMPGYHDPVAVDADTVRTGLSSRVFSQSTSSEFQKLKGKFNAGLGNWDIKKVDELEGWVALIQKKGSPPPPVAVEDLKKTLKFPEGYLNILIQKPFDQNGYPPYRLLVIKPDRSASWVYAYKIDICTGAGVMRLQSREMKSVPPLYQKARSLPWLKSSDWEKDRKILHGMEALRDETLWAAGHRFCVYGGGGIGLNQIERAHDEGTCMDWFARDQFYDTFNLRRNDTVLRSTSKLGPDYFMDAGDLNDVREKAAKPNLYPGSPKWRMAEYTKVESAVESSAKLNVKVIADATAVVRDFWKAQELNLLPEGCFGFSTDYKSNNQLICTGADIGQLYDRLILCLGQEQDVYGEPKHVNEDAPTPITHSDGRMVGLQAEGGDIRILGAAAVMYPGFAANDAFKKMETFRQGLPVSAVLPGFILAAVNIATANGFFDAHPNRNVNTMSQAELQAVVPNAAAAIVEGRKSPNNGFATMQDVTSLLQPKGLAANLDQLTTDYPKPDTW